MSFAKFYLGRGHNGRTSHTRFVEVKMPAIAASYLVIELEGGVRIMLSEPSRVAWVAQLLVPQDRHRDKFLSDRTGICRGKSGSVVRQFHPGRGVDLPLAGAAGNKRPNG